MRALPLIAIIMLLAVGPCPTEQQTLDQLAWLAGHWQGGSGNRVTEELWLPPAGGLMLGLNRDISAKGKAFFEYLRLEATDGEIFYRASPLGGTTTSFKLVVCKPAKAVFENRAHDFPQRITYALTEPDKLQVTISGIVDGKTECRSWSWTRLSDVAAATGGKKP